MNIGCWNRPAMTWQDVWSLRRVTSVIKFFNHTDTNTITFVELLTCLHTAQQLNQKPVNKTFIQYRHGRKLKAKSETDAEFGSISLYAPMSLARSC